MNSLKGRVALVTGVSRKNSIGFGIAKCLASMGADLFLQSFLSYDKDMGIVDEFYNPEKMLEELREKQMRILPGPPYIDGIDISVIYQPCNVVGGDFETVEPSHQVRIERKPNSKPLQVLLHFRKMLGAFLVQVVGHPGCVRQNRPALLFLAIEYPHRIELIALRAGGAERIDLVG